MRSSVNMRCLTLAASALLIPMVLSSAPAQISAHSLLDQVPALPGNPLEAYGQWTPQDDGLAPGTAFKAVSDSRVRQKALIEQQVQSAAASPPPQLAQATAFASSPEAQANMRAMQEAEARGASDAEKMALIMKMAGHGPRMTPVSAESPHDTALKNRVFSDPKITNQVINGMKKVHDEQNQLDWRRQTEIAAIDRAEQQALAAIPICPNTNHSEYGPEPSKIAVRDTKLRFADQRIAVATHYLPEYQSLAREMKIVVQPAVDQADAALAAWTQLEGPMLKMGTAGVAQSAANQALDNVGDLEALIEDASKSAALTVSARKKIERVYGQARGC
jgi:hypothetical protein